MSNFPELLPCPKCRVGDGTHIGRHKSAYDGRIGDAYRCRACNQIWHLPGWRSLLVDATEPERSIRAEPWWKG
jgi:hypothetical protein